MNSRSVLDPKDWLQIIAMRRPGDDDGAVLFGFEAEVGGTRARGVENGPLDDSLRELLGYTRGHSLLSKYMLMLLVLSLAFDHAEILRELGVEVRAEGKVRLASLAVFREFEDWKEAYEDLGKGKEVQRRLRNVFSKKRDDGTESLIGFTLDKQKRWMQLRVIGGSQMRIAPDVLELIKARLRTEKRDANANDDSVTDFFRALSELLGVLYASVGRMPDEKLKKDVARWVARIERWTERVILALQAPNGRAAAIALCMAILFPRQGPTRDQIRELFEAMGPDVMDEVGVLLEEARRGAARGLCRDALKTKFGPLPAKVRARLDSAAFGQLRRWLLRGIVAKTLRDVFRARIPEASPPPPRERAPRLKATSAKMKRHKQR